ncbi:MAG TPA: NADH-quinone oxidoreductase subunit NuoB [Nitrospiria bacterium]
MFRLIKQGLKTGVVTTDYPDRADPAPPGYRGKPEVDASKVTLEAFEKSAAACPSQAIRFLRQGPTGWSLEINYGRCVFCGLCEEASQGAVRMTEEYELAAKRKEDLVLAVSNDPTGGSEEIETLGDRLKEKIGRLFGRSLHIREVDAGSCNACEWEITALLNPIYDIQRFGIDFVASPRHADMLLVTGPVTRNMETALKKTYDATPDPKLVAAVGACACDGGLFAESYACRGGLDRVLPVDVYIPGCPPRPQALLHGILLALDRLPQKIKKGKILSNGS